MAKKERFFGKVDEVIEANLLWYRRREFERGRIVVLNVALVSHGVLFGTFFPVLGNGNWMCRRESRVRYHRCDFAESQRVHAALAFGRAVDNEPDSRSPTG